MFAGTINEEEEWNADTLNFSCGYAAYMVDRLVAHRDVEEVRARNHIKKQEGASSKNLLKQVKRLTSAGELVRVAITHEIGMDILTELTLRKTEMEHKQQQKEQKKLETHIKHVGDLLKLRAAKPNES